MRPMNYVFGEIPGVPVGTRGDSLNALKEMGIHVSSTYKHRTTRGVPSLILGDKDKDRGELITIIHETLIVHHYKKPNVLSLIGAITQNKEKDLPIRVIRSARLGGQYNPLIGYRYDGLYRVSFIGNSTFNKPGYYLFVIQLQRLPNQPMAWEEAPIPTPPSHHQGTIVYEDLSKKCRRKASQPKKVLPALSDPASDFADELYNS